MCSSDLDLIPKLKLLGAIEAELTSAFTLGERVEIPLTESERSIWLRRHDQALTKIQSPACIVSLENMRAAVNAI